MNWKTAMKKFSRKKHREIEKKYRKQLRDM